MKINTKLICLIVFFIKEKKNECAEQSLLFPVGDSLKKNETA